MQTQTPSFTGPTHTRLRIDTVEDALKVIYRCMAGDPSFPQVTGRLDDWRRRKHLVTSGAVFVFKHRVGLKRWTDGLRWSSNKQDREFLHYKEVMGRETVRSRSDDRTKSIGRKQKNQEHSKKTPYRRPAVVDKPDPLLKYTYTTLVSPDPSHPELNSKWQIVWYHQPVSSSPSTLPRLISIHEHPTLRTVIVPRDMFRPAKSTARSPERAALDACAERTLSPFTSDSHSPSSNEWTYIRFVGPDFRQSPTMLRDSLDLPAKLPQIHTASSLLPTPTLPRLREVVGQYDGDGRFRKLGWEL